MSKENRNHCGRAAGLTAMQAGTFCQSGVLLVCLLVFNAACSQDAATQDAPTPPPTETTGEVSAGEESDQTAGRRFGGASLAMPADMVTADPAANAGRVALFGDLHVHTMYSFDAFAFGTLASPGDAYRYAKGAPIRHPAGFDVQLDRPLDFYAVTDHAMFLGAMRAAADTSHPFSQYEHVFPLHNMNAPENMNLESLSQRVAAFSGFLGETIQGIASGDVDVELVNDIARDAWADIILAARTHNNPGTFTTFVAYEYTSSTDDRGNLHRNVVFRDADRLPALPFSRFHSQNPEGLWAWMDDLRSQGIESLAIPHNSNGSNGQMFKLTDWSGAPIDDAYAAQRIRNEPIVEITQVKGTSETHPALSDTDEWADFEIMPFRVATTLDSQPSGSYAREALLNGMAMAANEGINPYQFGFVGASDTHTAAASLEEETYFSKVGLLDSTGQLRGSVPVDAAQAEIITAAGRAGVESIGGKPYVTGAYDTWGASGLTGVWAERNERDAIYSAFRRKETFATSGPRIQVRLFAGYEFQNKTMNTPGWIADAYAHGVSMGSELPGREQAPTLLAWAVRDSNGAPLQRLQIVKGWIEDGDHKEKVFDAACSGGAAPDARTARCPDNGARVNTQTCATEPGTGAGELSAAWQDPEYSPDQHAFYYVRVLENPTCRWSTWDAIRAGVRPRPDLPETIQERAWTSPIWLIPDADG